MKQCAFVVCGLLLLAAAPLAGGQAQQPTHAPDFRARQRIAPLYFPPKPNAPFMAIAHTTWVQILPDGSTVTHQNARVVARDMDGRIFQERRTFVPVPNPTNQQSVAYETEYDDPVAHAVYRCTPAARVCNVFAYYPQPSGEPRAGLQPDGTTYLTRENLGADTFAGIDVERSRETYTFYRASIGNTNTILRTIDYWYSPELGVNVQVKRHDPRDGDQTLWLSDLSLTPASPEYFRIPAGYRIIDHRRPAPQAGAPQQ